VVLKAHVALLHRNLEVTTEEGFPAGGCHNATGECHGAHIMILDNERGSKVGKAHISAVHFHQTGKYAHTQPTMKKKKNA